MPFADIPPHTMSFPGNLFLSWFGTSVGLCAQTRSFWWFGLSSSSKGLSSLKLTFDQPATVQFHLSLQHFSLFFLCFSVIFGIFCCKNALHPRFFTKYICTVFLETWWPAAVSLVASFCVGCRFLIRDFAITILGPLFNTFGLPDLGLSLKVCPC